MIRGLCRITSAIVVSLGFSFGAVAQEKLILTSLVPATSPHSAFFKEWAKRVNDASNGTLAIEVRDGTTLANYANAYDRTMSNVVQIGWTQLAQVSGKFPLASVTDLPFTSDGGKGCAVASWRLHKSGLVDKEYQDIVPLWFGCLGLNGLHFNKTPASNTSLNGLKIRVASKLASEIITTMGGTPISLSAESVYEALQRGTIDGAVTSWTAFGPLKFADVTSSHLEVPLGSTASMFFMSKAKFESLPEAARKAIIDNSGEAQSRAFGEFLARQANSNRSSTANNPKHSFVNFGEAQSKLWQEKLAPIQANWISANPGGDKALRFFQGAHADVLAGR